MAATDSTLLGRPLWYELMTTDMKGAEAFYTAVIGWTAAPFEATPQPYSIFKRSGDVSVAGMMTTPAGVNAPPFWAMYVGVPNVEEAAAHIERLGGRTCTEVIEVPDVGRLQMMTDPQGAAFYIYQPANTPPGPEGAPELGEASWLELMTTDAPAAMKFYQDVFGWQPSEAMDMGEMGQYQMFNRGERMIGGMMNKPAEMAHVPPHWAIYFSVPDINEATERVKGNGGQILNGPMEVPGGDWIVNGMDPQGATFALHERKSAAA
jgi:uncharacterized protein